MTGYWTSDKALNAMGMINAGLFSSNTGKWNTPKPLLEKLYTEFDFDLDPCSDSKENPNVKARIHYTEEDDGLSQAWFGVVYMNPPYGREIGKWVYLAATCNAKTVVCLLPARTDTRWWQDNVPGAPFVVFIRGRLRFGNATNSAPFPSAIVVFGEINSEQKKLLSGLGWAVEKREE